MLTRRVTPAHARAAVDVLTVLLPFPLVCDRAEAAVDGDGRPRVGRRRKPAVADGQADSVNSWVSAALAQKVDRDRRLGHLQAAMADYEAESGEITVAEMVAQARADREDAVVVRSRGTGAARGAPRRAKPESA